MRFHSGPCSRLRLHRGFTLIELIVAIGIGIALAGIGSMAFKGVGDSQALSLAESQILGALDLARQSAMTRNQNVQFRFYKMPGERHYTAVGVASWDDTANEGEGDFIPESKPIFLSNGVIIYDTTTYSKIFHLEEDYALAEGNAKILRQNADYQYFFFYPTGATDITDPEGDANCFFTLVLEKSITGSKTPINFITISLSPATGRAQSRRP